MNGRSAGPIEVVEQQGSFLLIRAGSRFAIVERRAGRIYPMAPGERAGKPMTGEGMAAAMAEVASRPRTRRDSSFVSSATAATVSPAPSANCGPYAASAAIAELQASRVWQTSSGVCARET
jgi:hypothetical protein